VQAIGVGIDIHQCKHAWEMYEASERRLQAAFEGARLGAWEWNTETGAVRITSQLAHIYDFPAAPKARRLTNYGDGYLRLSAEIPG